MPTKQWIYPARFVRAVDGDTFYFTVDMGNSVLMEQDYRALHINAPELHGATREAGLASKWWAETWFRLGVGDWPFLIESRKSVDKEKYGRYLATVWRVSDGACFNEDSVAWGKSVPYMIGKMARD